MFYGESGIRTPGPVTVKIICDKTAAIPSKQKSLWSTTKGFLITAGQRGQVSNRFVDNLSEIQAFISEINWRPSH